MKDRKSTKVQCTSICLISASSSRENSSDVCSGVRGVGSQSAACTISKLSSIVGAALAAVNGEGGTLWGKQTQYYYSANTVCTHYRIYMYILYEKDVVRIKIAQRIKVCKVCWKRRTNLRNQHILRYIFYGGCFIMQTLTRNLCYVYTLPILNQLLDHSGLIESSCQDPGRNKIKTVLQFS